MTYLPGRATRKIALCLLNLRIARRSLQMGIFAAVATARKLIEIANSVEAVQDGRIVIELINGSGTFVKFTQADAELFA
jgi:hypothetical protein